MRELDLTTTYVLDDLPAQRDIENPEIYPVPAKAPPLRTVEKEPYEPSPELVRVVDLSIALGRPLLLQGDPGCGKTRLAYSLAYSLGMPLEVAVIKSTSRAQDLLYSYDAVRRLYDSQLGAHGAKDKSGEPLARDVTNYIELSPLGRAIARAQVGRRSVVLIDEIDKADLDFPNDLLWELDRMEFRVTEAPQMAFEARDLRPIVIITHNEEKPLPPAFLRRCVYHYVEFPQSRSVLEGILKLHGVKSKALIDKSIALIKKIHELELNKQPGLSELIDWVRYQEARGRSAADLDKLPDSEALFKDLSDQKRAQREMTGA